MPSFGVLRFAPHRTMGPHTMDRTHPSAALQWGHARTVFVERPGSPEACVVKRFRHPRWAGRLRDRSRAKWELRWLRELSSAGVSVPAPHSIQRQRGAWEVRMEWIEGALDLRELIALEPAAWPCAPEQLARGLGALLAALHANGVAHPDLHPGNVLIDPHGRAWAIDFHRARPGPATPARVAEDLVALESALRERTPATFRLRAARAWFRAIPAEVRQGLVPLRALLERVARAAVPHRRREVERLARRWTRESELCCAEKAPNPSLRRRELPDDIAERIQAHVRNIPDRPSRPASGGDVPLRQQARLEIDGFHLDIWMGPEQRLTDLWVHAGRLEEHALPAARPFALRTGPLAWLALEVPPGARPVEQAELPHDLARRLADRALGLAGTLRLLRGPDGFILGPVDRLLPHSPG